MGYNKKPKDKTTKKQSYDCKNCSKLINEKRWISEIYKGLCHRCYKSLTTDNNIRKNNKLKNNFRDEKYKAKL